MRKPTKPSGGNRGTSLPEVTLALSVLALLAYSFGFMVPLTMEQNRSEQTREQVMRVKRALIGEPSVIRLGEGNISRFGYVGDMGSFPAALGNLIDIGAQPAYEVTSIIELGSGWRGPYIATDPLDFLEDPWGNPLELDTTQKTSASTGSTVVATIRSLGGDGVADTADDESVEIYKGEAKSDLFGYIRDPGGNTIPGVDVVISYPDAGSIITTTTATDADGFYSFGLIPHGERVIEVNPKLSYQQDTAFTTTVQFSDVEFVIENLGKDSTTVTSFTLTYSSSPPAYYEQVRINDSLVFNSTSPRAGSGDVITFPAELVAGTNVIQEPQHLVVSSLAFQVPEISINAIGTGGTLNIELSEFADAPTGGGAADVDMTGVTFEIVFSDGSTTLFTTRQMP